MSTRIKATDFQTLTRCDRQVYLDYHGDKSLKVQDSSYTMWLRGEGVAHEQVVVEQLGEVERILYDPGDLDAAFEITAGLMERGVRTIYQGVLIGEGLIGIPDLLRRADGASRWGHYHYEPVDVKYTSTTQEGHRLQVMAYIALLEAIQGVRPKGYLLLRPPPSERADPHETIEYEVVFDEAVYSEKRDEIRRLSGGYGPQPFISSVCDSCQWQNVCVPIAERRQDVSLITGLRRKVWAELQARGLGTLPAAANADPGQLVNIKGIGQKTALDIVNKARALHTQQVIGIREPDLPTGSPWVFFDIESMPSRRLIYLMGFYIEEGADEHFEYLMARSPEEEGDLWAAFLKRAQSLKGPIIHYGHYEKNALEQLAGIYGGEAAVESIQSRMFDLRKAIMQSVVLPLRSTSLKEVAGWLGYEWTGETTAADDSMVAYARWLEDGDESHLNNVLLYNEHDCRATAKVFHWLQSLTSNT